MDKNSTAYKARSSCIATKTHGQAVLDLSFVMYKEILYLAAIAKTAGTLGKNTTLSPVQAMSDPSKFLLPTTKFTENMADYVKPEILDDIITGYARYFMPVVTTRYGIPGYIFNQRVARLGFSQLMILLFPFHPEVAKFANRLDGLMTEVIETSVYTDGAYIEQSFDYNAHTRDLLLTLAQQQPRNWTRLAMDAVVKHDRLRAGLAAPFGGLPQVGNYIWPSSGKTSINPSDYNITKSSMAFPYGGYYVQRSNWKSQAHFLFMHTRRQSWGHSMAGTNSIQVVAYGKQLIVASGLPKYDSGNEKEFPLSEPYLAENSTWKTSTVAVDGCSQFAGSAFGEDTFGDNPAWVVGGMRKAKLATVPLPQKFTTSVKFDYMDGLHDGGYCYQDNPKPKDPKTYVPTSKQVSHRRAVLFIKKVGAWLIIDVMNSTDADAHTYTQIWNLPRPEFANGTILTSGFLPEHVNCGGDSVIVDPQTPDGVGFALYQHGTPDTSFETHWGGHGGPFGYRGVARFGVNTTLPGVDVHTTFTAHRTIPRFPQPCPQLLQNNEHPNRRFRDDGSD
ncbi:hypothetical protein HDU96_002467 [Phlyctochytrium bullatum]|nr:hypothetical protein HDU96_002467 [Phlyctochytrium bullatum]